MPRRAVVGCGRLPVEAGKELGGQGRPAEDRSLALAARFPLSRLSSRDSLAGGRAGCGGGGTEARDGSLLVIERWKDGVQLCDLHQVPQFPLQVEEFDGTALVRSRCVCAD